MTADPMVGAALELLARGHALYPGEHVEPGAAETPERLREHTDRLGRASTLGRTVPSAARSVQLASDLRRLAAADAELTALMTAAHAGRAEGRGHTRAILDAARADSMHAADTPIGRREALRRMAGRLRAQRRHIHASRRHARRLTARMVPLSALHYNRSVRPGHVRKHIAVALDQLGIKEPRARRNWMHGYQTLIARESTYRPWAIASEPATAPGPIQPDGYGLGYARGLTQTIPATFAHYHQPGTSTNIYDPVANICASMNYVMRRYGVSADGSNLTALVQQADPRRPPKGY